MADAITGPAELDATKNTIAISLVQKELKEAVKLLPTVSDFSAFAGKGVKQIEVPRLDSFTAVNRTSGTCGDATALTTATDPIALDQNLFVSWVVDSFCEMQSNIAVQQEFLKRAASAHARKIDELIISTVDAAAALNINGAAPADITRDNVLDMREQMCACNGDMDNLVLVLGCDQDKAMLKIEEFTRADIYGSSNVPAGFIGRVFGVPVIVSNLVEAQQAYMYERSSVGVAFQQRPNLASAEEICYGSKARRFVLDQAMGISALQLGLCGAGVAESPLIAKLKD